MISNVLKFISDEVNKYLILKTDPGLDPSITKWVELGDIAKIQNNEGKNHQETNGKIILSLVNIEEDRLIKSPNNFTKTNDRISYKNPKIFLNLYCLFSAINEDYEKGLHQLSLILQYFQSKNVIDHQNSPSDRLDPRVEKLIFNLISLKFEQLNQLWGILGGKYLPSVLYKMQLIGLEDDSPGIEAAPILEIAIKDSKMNN